MAQPTKPGNAERGWNDPPMFLHTPAVSGQAVQAPTTKRTLLNKRVAYQDPSMKPAGSAPAANIPPPLLPTCGPPPAGNVILLPPSSTVTALPGPAPLIVPNMMTPSGGTTEQDEAAPKSPEANIEVPDFADDNQMFHYVLSHLRRVLCQCKPEIAENLSSEIEKKIGVFENMWENGRISYQVKTCMARLSIALCRRQCDLADEIHLALMMDYVSEVGQWMVGIKRLIQEARSVPALTSPDATQTAAPHFPPSAPEPETIDRSSENQNLDTDIRTNAELDVNNGQNNT